MKNFILGGLFVVGVALAYATVTGEDVTIHSLDYYMLERKDPHLNQNRHDFGEPEFNIVENDDVDEAE